MFTSVRGDDMMMVSVPNKTVRGAAEVVLHMILMLLRWCRRAIVLLLTSSDVQVAGCVITNESRIALTVVESQYNEPRQLQLDLLLDLRDAARLGTVLGAINGHLSNDPAVHKELPFGASVVGIDAEHVKLHVVCGRHHLNMCSSTL